MKKIKILSVWGLALLAAAFGCNRPEAPAEEYLIRSGDFRFSARDFLQAFEFAKTNYPGTLDPQAPALKAARRALFEEMQTELVLLRRAAELKVAVTPAELEAAVADVKKDYPPEVFEQTLLAAAVPFETWKRRLQTRLLLDKLVERELRPQALATAEEAGAELRQKKIEAAFGPWIESLKTKYPIEVNTDLWERLNRPAETDDAAADTAEKKAQP